MSQRSGCRWGTHADFAQLYETFLDAVYPPHPSHPAADGRRQLATSVGTEIRARNGTSILDCAAGTGFPALALIEDGFDVHCSDGDPEMADVLAERAEQELHLSPEEFAPPRRPGAEGSTHPNPLVLDWMQLEQIPRRYDYVLCRGNSLAYADTWTGRSRVATAQLVTTYLERMMWKVRPGGYLHVDAPWKLELPTASYQAVGGSDSIWEHVSADETHREWTLSFKLDQNHQPIAFRRYSSLLTIDRVETAVKALGMEDTVPFQLHAERPGFGTIIARRPR